MLTKLDIDWLKSEFMPDLVIEVKKALSEKLDAIDTKLDKFVGEIEKRRTEQTLHAGDHSRITDRFDRIDKHFGISTAVWFF